MCLFMFIYWCFHCVYWLCGWRCSLCVLQHRSLVLCVYLWVMCVVYGVHWHVCFVWCVVSVCIELYMCVGCVYCACWYGVYWCVCFRLIYILWRLLLIDWLKHTIPPTHGWWWLVVFPDASVWCVLENTHIGVECGPRTTHVLVLACAMCVVVVVLLLVCIVVCCFSSIYMVCVDVFGLIIIIWFVLWWMWCSPFGVVTVFLVLGFIAFIGVVFD